MNSPVTGYCDPAFRFVREAFAENFETRDEIGACCTILVDNHKVVDLWGGHKDSAKTQLWQENTISLVFSCSKAATALCAQILIDRNQLDLDAPVTQYWPEFGAHGKQDVTVRMMLAHQSAVPALRDPVKPGGLYDFDYMVKRLAAEKPFWIPGTDNGYHMISFGWTVGELIRRVSQQSLGTFFKNNIAIPLELDFHIGLPESEFARACTMIPFNLDQTASENAFLTKVFTDPTSIQHLAMMNTGQYYFDHPDAWRAEIGGGGGLSNARSLARMFASLLGKNTSLSPARIEDMRQPVAQTKQDLTLLIPTRFGQGFMLRMDNRQTHPLDGYSLIIGEQAFGHVGMGGSVGFADPQTQMAFGYSMNKMGNSILLNQRGQSLIDAAYESL